MNRREFLGSSVVLASGIAKGTGTAGEPPPQDRAGLVLFPGPDMPELSLFLGNRPTTITPQREGEVTLRAPESEVTLQARFTRERPFEFCRIRHAPGSSLVPEELKLEWGFPMQYNESMTFDADALAGHPLYLPDSSIPPAHYLNWGTLFYNR